MFVFQAKKGKLLGKINSLSGIATKTLQGKDKLSLQGQEEKSLRLWKHQTLHERLVRKKNHEMRTEKKPAEIIEKIKKIENN